MMASLDAFEITLRGKSCHAAMPESGADPIVAAAQLIMALQTIPFPPPVAAGFRGGQYHPDKRRRGDQRPAGHRGAARYLPLPEQSRSRPRARANRKLCGDPAAGVRCAG